MQVLRGAAGFLSADHPQPLWAAYGDDLYFRDPDALSETLPGLLSDRSAPNRTLFDLLHQSACLLLNSSNALGASFL